MADLLPDRTWLWLATGFYAAAFVSTTWMVVRDRRRSRGATFALMGAGLVLQTIGLYLRGLEAGGCPVRNTFELVQFVTWATTLLYLVVGSAFHVSLLGYFTSALALALSGVSLLVPGWDRIAGTPVFGGNPWIEVHATLGLLAYGAFGVLATTSLMFLLQTFSLKRKHLRGLFAWLPPLVALESINYRLLVTGIVVLSFSIAVGVHYFQRDPAATELDKLLVTIAVWAAYAVVLLLRIRRRLVSRRLAWAGIVLFVVALLSLGPITRRPPASADHAEVAR